MIFSQVTTDPIDTLSHETMVEHEQCGAIVAFSGVVRDHDGGKSVTRLSYEAHPDASDVLADIANQISERSDIRAVAISHRIGDLAIGDVALAVAVSAAHRAGAFAACIDLVDEVKCRLPIWKHQFFSDGTDEWVNSP